MIMMKWIIRFLTVCALLGGVSAARNRAFQDLNSKINLLKSSFQREIDDLKFEMLDLKAELNFEKGKTARLEELLNGTGSLAELGTRFHDDILQQNVGSSGSLAANDAGLDTVVSDLSLVKDTIAKLEDDVRTNTNTIDEVLKEQQASEHSFAVLQKAFKDEKENVNKTDTKLLRIMEEEIKRSSLLKDNVTTLQNDVKLVKEKTEKSVGDIADIQSYLPQLSKRMNESAVNIVDLQNDIQLVFDEVRNSSNQSEQVMDRIQDLELVTIQHAQAMNQTRDELAMMRMAPGITDRQDCLDIINAGGQAMAALLYEGVTVKRGADWKWSDQDENGEGKVTDVDVEQLATQWIKVTWNNGHSNSYRMGIENAYDLMIVAEKFDFSKCNL